MNQKACFLLTKQNLPLNGAFILIKTLHSLQASNFLRFFRIIQRFIKSEFLCIFIICI